MFQYLFFLAALALTYAARIGNGHAIENVPSNINEHETGHTRIKPNEFQTAHKITSERFTVNDGLEKVMRFQNTQTVSSRKEKPQLNPVLSVVINEDIMKSIESKRALNSQVQHKTNPELNGTKKINSLIESNTEANFYILTTSENSIQFSEDGFPNKRHVDQLTNLDEAGSESNQKSRIQIKKGPNGVDYEYEYVYYYYDEDEKNDKHTTNKQQEQTNAPLKKEGHARNRSRYTNIDRSGITEPDSEVQGNGKAALTVASGDIDEVRLPQNTRFPPRNRNGDTTPASDVASEKSSQRAGVKRPSLDLIDSDTFNTNEKQVKNSRNLENESVRKPLETSSDENIERQTQTLESEDNGETTDAESDVEQTTPLMEKAAWDLYAIIANENFNVDATTGDVSDLTTTDVPTTSADEVSTVMEEETSTPATTTTTTEPAATTSTTTSAPTSIGRKGQAGRKKFKLKNAGASSTTTEATIESGKSGSKPKGRLGRPSFGSGRVSRPNKEIKEEKKQEIVKEEVKHVSSSSLRGRTKNRFSLRVNSSTTEKSVDENSSEVISSTTSKTQKGRSQLSIRGRGRSTLTNSTTPETLRKSDDSKATTASAFVRPSRFNLGRPIAGGANRLLPRGRGNSLKATVTQPMANQTEDNAEANVADEATVEQAISSVVEDTADKSVQDSPPLVGLNRLKSRTKTQPNQKSPKAPVSIVRKPSPLIGRKRIGTISTTEATEETESTKLGASDNDNLPDDNEDTNNGAASVASEQIAEVALEQPTKGFGLISNRRRLLLRKPGTVA